MTTLPSSDTSTKQRELLRLMHACYPYDAEHTALPMWGKSCASEPEWHTERTEQGTGLPVCIVHKTYADAHEYWLWEWRLLDCRDFYEKLQLIDEPLLDVDDPTDWNWFADSDFADSAGDMG